MDTSRHDNVVPLIDVTRAYRARLYERAKQSDVVEFVSLSNAVLQIDRWLDRFALRRARPGFK